jgi:erythromycin esterase-like protein
MVSFVQWMKKYNNKYCNTQQQRQQQNELPVQLLGMDIQFPFDSMEYIIQQLKAFGENDLASLVEEYYKPLFKYQSNIRIYGGDVYIVGRWLL